MSPYYYIGGIITGLFFGILTDRYYLAQKEINKINDADYTEGVKE